MSDHDLEFKIVKTNPREETYEKPVSKYSYRTITATRKVHDLEIHHPQTGEPLFSMKKKEYGKGYNLSWHPHMAQLHDGLEHSFEHGFRHHNREYMSADSQDSAKYIAQRIYHDAARKGFKDTFPHSRSKAPGAQSPLDTHLHIHDPDTGEKMVTHGKWYKEDGSYEHRSKYHPWYLQNHNIPEELVKNIKAPDAYRFAEEIHKHKGKSFSAVGVKSWASKDTYGHSSKMYKAAEGKSDHELSTAHEEHLKKQHGDKVTITRHAPNVFHAEVGENNDQQMHITSLVHNGKLVTHQIRPNYEYSGTKLNHGF